MKAIAKFDPSMTDREMLECILDLFDNDIVVWRSDHQDGHYEPKGGKQELYRKIYEFRLDFHNTMVTKKMAERMKNESSRRTTNEDPC